MGKAGKGQKWCVLVWNTTPTTPTLHYMLHYHYTRCANTSRGLAFNVYTPVTATRPDSTSLHRPALHSVYCTVM